MECLIACVISRPLGNRPGWPIIDFGGDAEDDVATTPTRDRSNEPEAERDLKVSASRRQS
jgi:hypothetical protein